MRLVPYFLACGLALASSCGAAHAQVFFTSPPTSSGGGGSSGGGNGGGGGGNHHHHDYGSGGILNNGGTVTVATGHGVIAGGNVTQTNKNQYVVVEVIGATGNNDPTYVNVNTSN